VQHGIDDLAAKIAHAEFKKAGLQTDLEFDTLETIQTFETFETGPEAVQEAVQRIRDNEFDTLETLDGSGSVQSIQRVQTDNAFDGWRNAYDVHTSNTQVVSSNETTQ